MRVLVTGAAGMMGRRLTPRLAERHEVHALCRAEPSDPDPGVRWIAHDLTKPLADADLPEAIDAIVHLAQSRRYRDFPEGAEDIFAVNVQSTSRLLAYARRAGASRFVLASTGGVYRRAPDPLRESDPILLTEPYFRSKRMAELLCDDYAGLLTAITLRFFFVYGPGEGHTLVPRLAQRILAGEELVVEGEPGMRMNPLHVDDAAAAIEAALALESGETINVAGAETVTITALIERLGHALDRTVRISHRGESPADLVADTTRMRTLLGVEPAVSLDRGLASVAAALAAPPAGG